MKAPIKFNNFVKLFKSVSVGSALENGTIYYNTDTDKVILVENGQEVDTVSSSQLENHIYDHNNLHQVTKAQVGLDRVNNTNDAEKPISDATQVVDVFARINSASAGEAKNRTLTLIRIG